MGLLRSKSNSNSIQMQISVQKIWHDCITFTNENYILSKEKDISNMVNILVFAKELYFAVFTLSYIKLKKQNIDEYKIKKFRTIHNKFMTEYIHINYLQIKEIIASRIYLYEMNEEKKVISMLFDVICNNEIKAVKNNVEKPYYVKDIQNDKSLNFDVDFENVNFFKNAYESKFIKKCITYIVKEFDNLENDNKI